MNHPQNEPRFNGNIPPQAPELEVAVLGFFISQKEILAENIGFMKPEFFYKESHSNIFIAMQNLYNRNDSVDLKTVMQELLSMGKYDEIGGYEKLMSLTAGLGYAPNIETHVRIITEKFIKREIIKNCSEIIKKSYDETVDLFDTIHQFDNFNSRINEYLIHKDYELDYYKFVDTAVNEIINQAQSGFTGIDTGVSKLNAITGGWAATDFIILCARPSMGKSTRMINFVKKACEHGKKVAIFSLEMSATQLIKKQIIEQSNVYANKIMESHIEGYDLQKIKEAHQVIRSMQIYLNEKTSITPNYIRQVCNERKKKYGLDMIFIDYLQLMSPNDKQKFQSEELKIASISTALKNLAKELKIPIMALCQLSREVERRQDKRPIKSDLRYSGQLEQDADLILSLYRPSVYYKFNEDPDYKDQQEETHNRISELGVIKNRHGKSEVYFEEIFYGELSRFETIN